MIFSVSHIHAVILITVLPVGFTRWSYGCAVRSSSVMSDSWLPYGLHVASQAAWFMGFSRQKYWSGLPAFLQGIFPTQESNPGLPHCRQILYHLSHQGSPDGTTRCNNNKCLQKVKITQYPEKIIICRRETITCRYHFKGYNLLSHGLSWIVCSREKHLLWGWQWGVYQLVTVH